MKQIAYPSGIREAAAKMGCDLGTHARFGADLVMAPRTTAPVVTKGGSTSNLFTTPSPNPYGSPTRATAPVVTMSPTAVQTVGKKELSNKVVALPANLNPKTAIAVADRLLNTPAAQPTVDRTFQIAALPAEYKIDMNPEAVAAIERAAATLDAAQKVRDTAQIPPSQPIIPVQTADQSAAVSAATTTYELSDADLEALASATQQMIDSSRHVGPIERFLDWLKKVLT